MKNRPKIWLVISLVGLVLLLVFALARAPEPSYQGKTVFDWMLQTRSSSLADNPGLSAIGSNAVPFLARALATTKTPYDRFGVLRTSAMQSLLKTFGVRGRWTKSSQEIRRAAAMSLLAFSFEARPALPQLHAELLRPDAADRQTVIHCLSALGPLPESVPFLVQAWPLTTNEAYVVRHDLLHALGQAGTNAATLALPLAVSALDDPEPGVRVVAANALENWGQPAPAAVPKLVTMLFSANHVFAAAAAGALASITNRADEAIQPLRRLMASTNDYARAVAAMASWQLGGKAEETRFLLESLLRSPAAKGTAARDLGRMGPAARDSIPFLLQASHENIGAWVDMYDRAQCAEAVLRIQGETPEAIGVLEEALAFQSNGWVRATVAGHLSGMGSLAAPLIPALRRATQDSDREVRHAAAAALTKLGAPPK